MEKLERANRSHGSRYFVAHETIEEENFLLDRNLSCYSALMLVLRELLVTHDVAKLVT